MRKKSNAEISVLYAIDYVIITVLSIRIALKGQKHQGRASPYYSGVSIILVLKGRNQDITLSELLKRRSEGATPNKACTSLRGV